MTAPVRETLHALRHAPTIEGPLRLRSDVDAPASRDEVLEAWSGPAPAAIAEFWEAARSAILFRDIDYGQWGLRLLDPRSCRARTRQARSARPGDFEDDDIVIGEFLGDQELLVLVADGSLRVALPLYSRPDWYRPADDLAAFLARYQHAEGAKFWEPGPHDIRE